MEWYYSASGKPVGPLPAGDIESLFATGQITGETLVWRKGLAQWAPLSETPEFFNLLADEPPPPLPFVPPKPSVFAQRKSEDDFLGAEPKVIEDPQVAVEPRDDPKPFIHPKLAGPWTRYFARSLDVSVLATILMTCTFLLLPYVSPALYLQAYSADPRALLLLTLPFALLLNAMVITLFGNSLGKALFAIKAMPLDGREKFSFLENTSREMRVWAQGLALGIPLLNLFTMIPAFRRVAVGEPAAYDLRIAMVRSFSESKIRRTIGMLISGGVFLLITMSNVMDKVALEDPAQPTNWRNPVTQTITRIPGNWQYEVVKAPDGATLYGFTNLKTGIVALLGVESAPNLDLQTYATALKSALASTTSLGNWSISSLPGVWKASGAMTAEGYPSTIYVTQLGTSFWRIVYIDQITRGPREIVENQMTSALLKSIGAQGLN